MKKLVVLSLLAFGLFFSLNANANNLSDSRSDRLFTVQSSPDDDPQFGKDSVKCVENLSLYREFFKQWKASKYSSNTIQDIIPPWRWVYNNCPKASKNTYIEGVTIVDYLMNSSKTADLKNKYFDTLMLLYDQRIKYFNQEGFVLGRKGMDILKYKPDAIELAYPILKKAIDIDGGNADQAVFVYLFETTIKMTVAEKLDKSVVVETYESKMPLIEGNISAFADKADKLKEWQNVKEIYETAFQPFATCEVLIPIFEKKWAEAPNDIDLLKKITSTLDKKRCTDSQLFFDATVKLNELEPSPVTSLYIAKVYLKNNEYQKAMPYLENASQIEDPDALADVFLLMATYYRENRNIVKAREYAQKSIQSKPSNGAPYILIGDLYASSASECGDNDLTKRVAYWAAVDMYIKAKQNDPTMAEDADKRISIYSRQFPTKETVFFYDLKNGESYNVGCWINVNTTVRTSN